jgi:hypothetical protein
VLDRRRLEQLSCECYSVVKRETDRLLGSVRQPASFRSLPEANRSPDAGSSCSSAHSTFGALDASSEDSTFPAPFA